MINGQRGEYFFRLEQRTRLELRERSEWLYERARRAIDLRIRHYPPSMRSHYPVLVEQMFRGMCEEDVTRRRLIENQQLYLRLAHAYTDRGR